jgi:hypothetical protein
MLKFATGGVIMKTKIIKITSSFFIVVISSILLLSGCTNSSKFTPDNTSSHQGFPTENTVKTSPNEIASPESRNSNTTETTQNTLPAPQDSGEIVKPAGENVKVKALYLTGYTVGSMKQVNHYIELAKNSIINSYVIDVKDDDGYVGYESQVPEVKDIGTSIKKFDADKVLKAFHDNNIHIIGRIVCFKDPVLPVKRPDLAIKNTNGDVWKDSSKKAWVNPYNKDSWSYLVKIAKEAVQKGFDEIQFDYVRFPSEGKKKSIDWGGTTEQKYEAINEFLDYAKKEMPGVIISADVFGIICESPADTEKIGQYLELVGKNIDYISPMAYPSHYAPGQIVNKVLFPKPDLDPYNVVYNTLVKAKNRISQAGDYKANVRPYLQDFTASWLPKGNYQAYGAEQVRQQIKAVNDAGYDQWILWDALNTYSESALSK